MLDRYAIVLLGPRVAVVNHLSHCIANAIATTFGGHPEDFIVSTLHPAAGDKIVEFPSKVLYNLAIYIGVFTVARGVDMQLKEWIQT